MTRFAYLDISIQGYI